MCIHVCRVYIFKCIHMHIYTYMCIHVYICTCTHICVFMCTYVHLHIYVYSCMPGIHIQMYTYAQVCLHVYTLTFTHICVFTYTYVLLHIYIYIYIYVYRYSAPMYRVARYLMGCRVYTYTFTNVYIYVRTNRYVQEQCTRYRVACYDMGLLGILLSICVNIEGYMLIHLYMCKIQLCRTYHIIWACWVYMVYMCIYLYT